MSSPRPIRPAVRWKEVGRPVGGLVRSLLTSWLALGVTFYIVPGRQSSGPLAVAGLVVAVAVAGVLLRPVLVGLAVVLGPTGLLLIGVVSQAVILDVALVAAPNVTIGSQPEVLLVSSAAAAMAAVVNWLFDSGSDEVFLAQLLGRARRVARRQRRLDGDGAGCVHGLLVIQLDGVGEQVLRQAITAGDVPTLAQWASSGTHTVRGWHTGLPATTPAAQAVLLHGDVHEVPSFRWFEKQTRRTVVANHPHDAADIQQRISDGHGLLADGGVSVSTLFSGDAPTPLLTMSDARLPPRSTHGMASFAATGGGVARVLVTSIGLVITELYQGRRQRRRRVWPRVVRGAMFAGERAVTSALLRDLDVAIVAEQIARRAPVIFVDFLDYDELAHHAGPTRTESMQILNALDRLIRFFADVIRDTGGEYEVVILSDHGQTQGGTFRQRSGRTLEDLAQSLTDETTEQSAMPATEADRTAPVERSSSVNLVLTGLARSSRHGARAVRGAPFPAAAKDDGIEIAVRARTSRTSGPGGPAVQPALVVSAAGSLAHIYLTDLPGRRTREDIERRHPRLVAGLVGHPHIGVVVVRSPVAGGLVAVGAGGWRLLTAAGAVGGAGADPVAVFGPLAAADLCALDGRRHVGDLVVLGCYDQDTGEVAAFENMVGSHGGLGGEQTEAFVMHPTGWTVPDQPHLCGLDVHGLLRAHVPTPSGVRR